MEIFKAFPALQLKTLDNVGENMAKTLQQCSIVFRTPWPHVHKLLDVLLVEAFCSLQRTLLDRLNSSGFSFIFHPTLELANIFRCIPGQCFCTDCAKNDNETLKAFNKTRFRRQFVPPCKY